MYLMSLRKYYILHCTIIGVGTEHIHGTAQVVPLFKMGRLELSHILSEKLSHIAQQFALFYRIYHLILYCCVY